MKNLGEAYKSLLASSKVKNLTDKKSSRALKTYLSRINISDKTFSYDSSSRILEHLVGSGYSHKEASNLLVDLANISGKKIKIDTTGKNREKLNKEINKQIEMLKNSGKADLANELQKQATAASEKEEKAMKVQKKRDGLKYNPFDIPVSKQRVTSKKFTAIPKTDGKIPQHRIIAGKDKANKPIWKTVTDMSVVLGLKKGYRFNAAQIRKVREINFTVSVLGGSADWGETVTHFVKAAPGYALDALFKYIAQVKTVGGGESKLYGSKLAQDIAEHLDTGFMYDNISGDQELDTGVSVDELGALITEWALQNYDVVQVYKWAGASAILDAVIDDKLTVDQMKKLSRRRDVASEVKEAIEERLSNE